MLYKYTFGQLFGVSFVSFFSHLLFRRFIVMEGSFSMVQNNFLRKIFCAFPTLNLDSFRLFDPQSMRCSERCLQVWLCNCKQTKNRPFCDGSHVHLDDVDEKTALFD